MKPAARAAGPWRFGAPTGSAWPSANAPAPSHPGSISVNDSARGWPWVAMPVRGSG